MRRAKILIILLPFTVVVTLFIMIGLILRVLNWCIDRMEAWAES